MKPITAAGVLLDAEFSVEPYEGRPTLVLESRFGRVRNPDYNPALKLLLTRLKHLGAVITDAIVDSTVSRHLDFEQRRLQVRGRLYPLRLAREENLEALRIALCAAQEAVAQRPGARGGNRHKRIRLFLADVEEEGLETLLAGGGEEPDPRVREVDELITRVSQPRRGGGQGIGLSPEQRQAVEQRAVDVVTELLESENWDVEDVSSQKRGYDLHASRGDEERHVEVKGTTGSGASVLLTRNEVRHAHANPTRAVLAVVSEIRLSGEGGSWDAEGGRVRDFNRWRLDDGVLEPRTYEWVLPPEPGRADAD